MRWFVSACAVLAVVTIMFTVGTAGSAARVSGTSRHRTRFLSVFGVFALLLTAACGDDDTAETTDTTGATETTVDEVAAFCDTLFELETALAEGPDIENEPIPADLRTEAEQLLQELRDTAPAEVAEPVTRIADTYAEGLETGNFDVINEAFIGSDTEVDTYMLENCELEHIELKATEYAFAGVPESVVAGPVAITLDNRGTEVHEAILFQVNGDVEESVEALLMLPQEEAMTKVVDLGGVFVPSGISDTFFYNLEPARYGIVCFLPTGATSLEQLETAQGEPHFMHGMFAEFEATS
jgi:hypothetical protein